MCRLYGFLATEPTRLECSLVNAQNALQVQSDRDRRGRRNADGWGIARWSETGLSVARSTLPAFADTRYAAEAARTISPVVIAHVRAATIGSIERDNIHPFQSSPWAFAHNGTLSGFEALAPRLFSEAHEMPRGGTDSELIFEWILGRMPAFGLDPGEPAPSVTAPARLIEAAVLDLVGMAIAAPGGEPPKLNFVLSDGVHMVASRWGNSLYWARREAVPDCAFCGTNHCPQAGSDYRAVVLASEPITAEPWHEVPEGTIIAVDADARLTERDLLVRAG